MAFSSLMSVLESAAPLLEYGCSGSPLVVGDLVVVLPGGGERKSVIAYDRLTGELRWSALDDRQEGDSARGRRQLAERPREVGPVRHLEDLRDGGSASLGLSS
mgnify:CR=1 FL=1